MHAFEEKNRQKQRSGLLIFRKVVILAATTLLFTACSSSKDSDPASASEFVVADIPANTVSQVGSINFSVYNGRTADLLGASEGLTDVSAEFGKYASAMNQAYINEVYKFNVEDTCEISIGDEAYNEAPNPVVDAYDETYEGLSAGDVLTITSPAGSWGEIQLLDDGWLTYVLGEDVGSLGDLPKNSTVSLPGAGFPAFNSIPIPSVDRITEGLASNLQGNYLTAESKLTWSSTMNPNTLTTLSLSNTSFDADGNALITEEHLFVASEARLVRGVSNTVVRGNTAVYVLNTALFTF